MFAPTVKYLYCLFGLSIKKNHLIYLWVGLRINIFLLSVLDHDSYALHTSSLPKDDTQSESLQAHERKRQQLEANTRDSVGGEEEQREDAAASCRNLYPAMAIMLNSACIKT